jgi:hypothetical protein
VKGSFCDLLSDRGGRLECESFILVTLRGIYFENY